MIDIINYSIINNMNENIIEKLIDEYILAGEFGIIRDVDAIDERLTGLRLFDAPLIGYADANDELFIRYQTDIDIMQKKFMHPREWLPEAQTVISIFFPFTDAVKLSNMIEMRMPSAEWLHARYEGQRHLNMLAEHLRDELVSRGFNTVAPTLDERYLGSYPKIRKSNKDFTVSWSERHAAYAAGVGTFGLSKGLITKRGVAGRFLSVITEMIHEPTARDYSGVYDYCNMCGKCIENCPANAISLKEGKQHLPCSAFLDKVKKVNTPRYGCGKCHVAVPCMDRAPNIKSK